MQVTPGNTRFFRNINNIDQIKMRDHQDREVSITAGLLHTLTNPYEVNQLNGFLNAGNNESWAQFYKELPHLDQSIIKKSIFDKVVAQDQNLEKHLSLCSDDKKIEILTCPECECYSKLASCMKSIDKKVVCLIVYVSETHYL